MAAGKDFSCVNECSRSHSGWKQANQQALIVPCILAAAHFSAAGNMFQPRKVVQLGASGGLYCRESKIGVLAPKWIMWDDIWGSKLPFMGFAENRPHAWDQGSVFRRKAPSLGLVTPQLFLLVQSRVWGPQGIALLPIDQDIADEGKTGIPKSDPTFKLDLFPKTSWSSFRECRGHRGTYIRQMNTPGDHMVWRVIPLPCYSAKASCEYEGNWTDLQRK